MAGKGWSVHFQTGPHSCDLCGEEWPRHPALEVACPVCKAPVHGPCKRPSGHVAMEPHADREQAALDQGVLRRCPKAPAAPARQGTLLAALLAAGLLLAGCGWPCDEVVHGACVYQRVGVEKLTPDSWERAIESSASYWNVSPEVLDGWTVVVHPGKVSRWICYGGRAWGCARPDLHEIHIAVHHDCPMLELAHEVGHAAHGDPFHWGGGWETVDRNAYYVSACDLREPAPPEEAP